MSLSYHCYQPYRYNANPFQLDVLVDNIGRTIIWCGLPYSVSDLLTRSPICGLHLAMLKF